MFAFLWQGQSHIKELLTNHGAGTEKKIEKLDSKIEKIYEILLSHKENQK